MSVVDLSRDTPPIDWLLQAVRRGRPCFYCGKPLTSPAVCWWGATGEIILHPGCVLELGLRLGRDVWEIECTSGSQLIARTTPELRQRLMAEESR